MARRRSIVLGVSGGFVAGVLVATLIALWLRPSGDPDASGDSGDSSGSGKRSPVVAVDPKATAPAPGPRDRVALPKLDLSAGNRRAPLPGLPDWSHAGYREGGGLPTASDFTSDPSCRIGAAQLGSRFGVRANDGRDDSAGLQKAIDTVRTTCTPKASYDKLSLIGLPSGQLDVSREIAVDADYLVIRGAGGDPKTGTRFVFRPDANTRYDSLTDNGADWDEDGMESGDAKGGWLWPGRGLFRVQSRAVHEDYQKDYAKAPANRKDLFEGTVNVHWKAGAKLREKPGGNGFAARAGDRVVPLKDSWAMARFRAGGYVNIRAANSMKFYQQMHALPTDFELQNLHMRQQIFRITAVDSSARTITLDKPLEFDVPVDSTSDGSEEIDHKTYDSKASPLVDPVVGVGLENFAITQAVPKAEAAEAKDNYGNMAPADEMNGIVLKWAVNDWVRGISTYMTGSHPIVTEEAKNIQVQDNYLDGAWNKGAGGNGYLRGSRVWDSLYAGNITRNLRHFTFQWSASDNVVIGNDFDSDLNLHGGWERRNLFELNTVHVSYDHRPGNCRANCGGEGGNVESDTSTWFPIWWGAGQKAVKWSGATGPQNVFFDNAMTKQKSKGAAFTPYYPDRHRIYQFGWNGSGYAPLSKDGKPIADWAGNETADFSGHGVDDSRTDPGRSLFLKSVG